MSDAHPTPGLDRRAVVARLLTARTDALVVTGLGSSTYDVAACGDHPRNFYLWGAMGGAAMMGLGLALAQPRLPVIVVTGDGEMLMGLGAFATIGLQQPPNLRIVVLDNELYAETGAQATHTVRTDLAQVARACGIADAALVRTDAEVDALAARLHRADGGPQVAVVKIAARDTNRSIALREGAYNKVRMRLALGLSAD
jgi:thiamine pyrophosphate-dependent acetolactate synthase large subunit-like protein